MPELIVKLKEQELRRVPILSEETRIGRDEAADLVIDNPGISRHHASVVYKNRAFYIRDAGSQNGLFVNGQRTLESPLNNGDVIALGKFHVTFSTGGGVPPQKLSRRTSLISWGDEPEPTFSDRVLNPVNTTALSAEDVQRLIDRLPGPQRTPSSPPAPRVFGTPDHVQSQGPPERTGSSPPSAPERVVAAGPAPQRAEQTVLLTRLNLFLGAVALALLSALLYLLATD